jgi:hypothetical protein
MDQGINNQDQNAGTESSRGKDYKVKESTAQPGSTPAEHTMNDWDSSLQEDVSVKNAKSDIEFPSRHGPLGGGD